VHDGLRITAQTGAQAVRLTLSRNVNWTAIPSQPWIQVTPSSGTGSGTVDIRLNMVGAPPGLAAFPASVTFSLTDGVGSSRTLTLSAEARRLGTTSPPFGTVDTPAPNVSGVTGAIPITGWALDDVEVASLTVCRAGVEGESLVPTESCGGQPQVFVGSASFVEGARPDVQAAFASYATADRAGWGLMLLTNMLPNRGNGTFTFVVYARDREGQAVVLGTRVISCDNANATAPFGAIDTPWAGGTATGAAFVNFGWALTPSPKHIPADGSTLMVYVDGLPIGRPSYNQYRSDIATLFPGHLNSDGAVGFKVLDTTTLSNGLHTISWTATDSAGASSGLGSRYFRVLNDGPANLTSEGVTSAMAMASAAVVDDLPLDVTPMRARRGWDADAPVRRYELKSAGRIVINGEEVDRFDFDVDGPDGASYEGYVRTAAGLRSLPIGSRLDRRTGRFTWASGVGFLGAYNLVFVRLEDERPVARREVRVVLHPKASGQIGPRVVIDSPRPQQDVAQPFTIGGWAADLDAPAGTGIDAVHVWAYPLAGGPPVFLGVAPGSGRSDVAAVYGEQFLSGGYGLAVQGLVPGHYDLAVFAWSSASGRFVASQSVRVTVR
jgi:hypothetical protein